MLFSGTASGGGGAGSLLKTVQIANDGGGSSATNSHTPMFGLQFKKGDMPSGQYPVLKTAGGTTVPYSYWNVKSWSDGSMKFIGVLPIFPDAISSGSTANLKVYSGGSAPSASSRTLTEVYSQNIKVLGNSGLDNISGDWVADLQSANVIETVVVGDGLAGKIWRLLVDFKQSGSAHGSLVTYFYVMALQDASGNLAGFRVLPRITQPWYDVDSPSKYYRSFTSLQLQYGSGPTTVDPIASNYAAKAFTWISGAGSFDANVSCTGNAYQSGVACRVSSTGTLPAGLAANTTYWIRKDAGDTLMFVNGSAIGNTFNGTSRINITDAGTGTHTITPIAYVSYFCSQWIAASTGRYIYFQGTGSIASEANLRIKADQAYDASAGIFPPWNISIGSVDSNSNYDWSPYCVANLTIGIGGTGERDDIGPINSQHSRHFFTQAAVDEKVMRTIGLAQAHLPSCFRNSSTKSHVNLSNTNYSGMSTKEVDTFAYRPNAPSSSGFTAPSLTQTWVQVFGAPDFSHQTQYTAYPYGVTAEPQYADMLFEMVNMVQLQVGSAKHITLGGTTYYNVAPQWKDAIRTAAWSGRDVAWAAALLPNTNPDLGAPTAYVTDMVPSNSAYLLAWNATQSSWWQDNGYWMMQGQENHRAPWQIGYMWGFLNIAASACEDADAHTMRSIFAKWPVHVKSLTGNLWALPNFVEISSTQAAHYGSPFLDNDGQWAPIVEDNTYLSWSNSGDLFTWDNPHWTPANGDKIVFHESTAPGGLSLMTPYYAVNTSGLTFQLAASPGGSVLPITDDRSPTHNISGLIPASPPSTGFIFGDGYAINLRGEMNWSLADGVTTTGFATAAAEMDTRLASYNWAPDPKYAYKNSR